MRRMFGKSSARLIANQWCTAPGAAVRQLAALGVAASWRLGRWAPLEGYLELAREDASAGEAELGLDAEERWEVRLGRLLAAMHRRCAPNKTHTQVHILEVLLGPKEGMLHSEEYGIGALAARV